MSPFQLLEVLPLQTLKPEVLKILDCELRFKVALQRSTLLEAKLEVIRT
jgi:hypothetical protein